MFEAEIVVAIFALEMTHARQLQFVWLELNSTYVVGLLRERSKVVSWRVKVRWWRIMHYISGINFRVFHIFREGNKIADILANPAIDSGVWFALILCPLH